MTVHPLAERRSDRGRQGCGALPALLTILATLAAGQASAVEQVEVNRGGGAMHLAGRVVVEARDGGLLLLEPDGVLWALQPEEIVARRSDERPLEPLSAEQLGRQLLEELPDGFRVHRTANYVVCYDTSSAYAAWCGALYERLYRGFYAYWANRGWELEPPQLPLAAIVFQSKADYVRYARAELGEAAESIVGYYSLRTNRVIMHDLTGADGDLADRRGGSSAARINFMLSRPEAGGNVATIIHEATHQLAFNSGLQARYADIPLLVSEGLAMYFETPDLASSRGWRTIGAVNRPRLLQFRRDRGGQATSSLSELLASDARFRNTQTAAAAYAEAWSWNYYLLRKHSDAYVAYLKTLGARTPLIYSTPEERVDDFRKATGLDLEALESDFQQYMRGVR